MKIYLFNHETGAFLGEDFADDLPMCPGRNAIPSHATVVAPPPFRRGATPVFNVAEGTWEVRPSSGSVSEPEAGTEPCQQAPPCCRPLKAAHFAIDMTSNGGLTMKGMLFLILAVTLFFVAPLHAVSYPPSGEEPTYLKDQEIMKVGALVHLFHSGTQDVRSAIRVNDILTVYREYPPDISGISKAYGKVKVIGTLGDYYFEGEVVEGYVLPGYIALKGTVACLVTTRFKPKH
jgi:hypothetical protein